MLATAEGLPGVQIRVLGALRPVTIGVEDFGVEAEFGDAVRLRWRGADQAAGLDGALLELHVVDDLSQHVLGPWMLQGAGEHGSGTATWMTGLSTLANHTVPLITRAAEAAGRARPRILSAVPIALCGDADAARETCNKTFSIYGKLPSYRAMLDREGAAGPGDVGIVGDEATVRAGFAELRDAGVTDFAAAPYPADYGAMARTNDFLLSEL